MPTNPMADLAAALAPRVLDEDDITVSARLWAEVRRQTAERGPAPTRSPYDGTVLRPGEPEPIPGGCIGSPEAPICVRAPGGRWTCPACGEQMVVSAAVGPRVTPCACRGDTACVHPGPMPSRRASPPAREGR